MAVKPAVSLYVIPASTSDRREFFENILSRGLNEFLSALSRKDDKELVKYHHTFHPVIHADFLVEPE
jgi:hypothetical protein